MSTNKEEIAKSLIEEKENASPLFTEEKVVEEPKSLGRIERPSYNEDEKTLELGWKNIPIENLPTQGLFYPEGTTFKIRSASVSEIRHFSTIEEEDFYDVTEKLNMVCDKCCRITMPNKMATFRDMKESDRFYIIFCIRELTFKDGENKLFVGVQDPQDGVTEQVEITKDKFTYYKIDDKLMQYYSHDEKCFIFKTKDSGIIRMFVPSLGVSGFIFNYIKDKTQKNDFYDKAFVKVAAFMFDDWRKLNDSSYKKAEQDSMGWDMKKVSIISKLAELIQTGVSLEIKHIAKSGAEVTVPVRFQGGIKSLFLISDIFGELL